MTREIGSNSMGITVAGESLQLWADRAVYWPACSTLFIADPHWGKAAAFLAGGLPVPQAGSAVDLARLDRLLDRTEADRLVILGDLLHAKAGRSPELFQAIRRWREQRPTLEVVLVRGNHDRHAGDPPAEWRFRCETEPVCEGPFAFRHYPEPTPGHYTLAGHTHPSISLRGAGRQRLRLPCFHFAAEVGTLPAFGGFTGNAAVQPAANDMVFAIAEGELVAVTPKQPSRRR